MHAEHAESGLVATTTALNNGWQPTATVSERMVDIACRVAGDRDLKAWDGTERPRDEITAQDVERVLARDVVAEPAQR